MSVDHRKWVVDVGRWVRSCIRFNEDGSGEVCELAAWVDFLSWMRGRGRPLLHMGVFSDLLEKHVMSEPYGWVGWKQRGLGFPALKVFHGIELVEPAGCFGQIDLSHLFTAEQEARNRNGGGDDDR